MMPPGKYPYVNPDDKKIFENLFETLFGNNQQLLDDITRVALHDAVLNTAIFWSHVWQKVSRDDQ